MTQGSRTVFFNDKIIKTHFLVTSTNVYTYHPLFFISSATFFTFLILSFGQLPLITFILSSFFLRKMSTQLSHKYYHYADFLSSFRTSNSVDEYVNVLSVDQRRGFFFLAARITAFRFLYSLKCSPFRFCIGVTNCRTRKTWNYSKLIIKGNQGNSFHRISIV